MGFIIKTLILNCRRNPCVGRNHDKIYTATMIHAGKAQPKFLPSYSRIFFHPSVAFVCRGVISHRMVDISIWCRLFAESCPWKAIMKHAGVPLSEFDFRAENIFAGKCNSAGSPLQRRELRSGRSWPLLVAWHLRRVGHARQGQRAAAWRLLERKRIKSCGGPATRVQKHPGPRPLSLCLTS